MTEYINELRGVIKKLHKVEAVHVETVPVTETFDGQIVWDGEVEVFMIRGQPMADRCYAWAYEKDDGGKRYFAVLGIPPVDSPHAAVRAAILSDAKNSKGKGH